MSHNVEELFLAAVTEQLKIELDKCYHPNKGERDYIATTENVVALAQAGLFFAGLASAPFTFGLGLGAAAATIVILKAGEICIETYQERSRASQQLPESYLNQQRELQRLALFILLRQAAFATFNRYYYSLHETLDDEGIQTFAQYVAHRLMKKLYAELCQHPQQLPEVDTLIDYLLSSIHQSWIMKTEEVTLKTPPNTNPLRLAAQSKKVATKHFCAKQRWLSDDGPNVKILGVETSAFYDQFQITSTRYDLGYITISEQKRTSIPLAIKAEQLQDLSIPEAEKQRIIDKSLFSHFVTAQEVEDYKLFYLSNPTINFNAYLSQHYHRPIIACCHDDRLQGIVFVGDYTKVNFYAADLSDCDFCDAIFNHANLCHSQMLRIKTNPATQFQHIYAEGSVWMGDAQHELQLHANMSFAKLNGSTWKKCSISTLSCQIGSEWLLAVLEDFQIEDYAQAAFQNRLQQEHDERLEYQERVKTLESRCNDLEIMTITNSHEAMTRIEGLQHEFSFLQQQTEKIEKNLTCKLDQISKQLDTYRDLARANAKAISDVGGELKEFEEKQKKRDDEQDIAIEGIRATQDILRSLQQYCVTEVYTDDYRSKTSNYIPLYISSSHMKIQAKPELLTHYLYQSLNRSKYIFVSGGAGYGQTFGVTRFGEGINATYGIDHQWIFIPLDASRITNKDANVVNALLETVFIKTQKINLMKYHCVIHISKLDSSGIAIDKWIRDAEAVTKLTEAPMVFIFTARTRFMEKSRLTLDRLIQDAPADYLECEVQPLIDEQIQSFFQLFPKQDLANICRSYQDRGIIDITTLGRTPLMLHIMTGVLMEYTQLLPTKRRNMQRIDFYAASWRALHARVCYKLPDPYQDYTNFMQEMYDLAKDMLKDRVDSIVYEITNTKIGIPKTPFQKLLETKMGALSPLSIVKNEDRYSVSFIHASLGYYLIAEILIENLFKPDFPNKETQQIWGRNYLTRTPEVLEFLVELLQQFPETIEHQPKKLMLARHNSFCADDENSLNDDIDSDTPPIERSRQYIHNQLLQLTQTTHLTNPKREANKKLASNALTVLCKWGRDLSHEYFSKLLLHYIDATNGLLSYAHFEDSDLTGSYFHNAILFRTKLSNTILKQARFLNANQFLEIGETPKTFTVYRSSTDTILAYPISPNSSSKKYQIAVVRIIENGLQLLRCWPAHDQEITAMELITYRDTVRMASVGLGGTLRVWDLHATLPPNEIAKLRGFKHIAPIHHMVWGSDGVHLATGDQEGHVRIWDVNQQKKIYKSQTLHPPIRALIWGKLNQILIAADNSHELFICYDTLSEIRTHEILPIFSEHTNQPIMAIYSLAFSPDEKLLAIGTAYGSILIYDLHTKIVSFLYGHKSIVTSLVWLDQLISSSRDQTIRIWPSATNQGSVFQHDHPVGKVDVLPNKQIISGIDPNCSRFYFWDGQLSLTASSGNSVSSLVSCMAANPRYPYVASGDIHGVVMLYPFADMVQPDVVFTEPLLTHIRTTVQQLFWSKNGQYLASIGQDQSIIIKDILDRDPKKPIFIRQEADNCPTHMIWTTDKTDAQILIIGHANGTLEYYKDCDEFRLGVSLSINTSIPIQYLSDRQSAPQLAVAIGQEIALCTLHSEEPSQVMHHTHPELPPKIIAWSPDGALLASTDDQHIIRIWSISNEKNLSLRGQCATTEIKCLLWTDQWLLIGNSQEIIYWNMSQQEGIVGKQQRKPVAARFLSVSHDKKIVLGHNTKILFFPQSDLELPEEASFTWQFKRLKGGFCATESDISGCKELSVSNLRYLRKNGAKQIARSSFFSLTAFEADRTEEHLSPLPKCLPHHEWIRFFSVSSQIPQQPLSLNTPSQDSPLRIPSERSGTFFSASQSNLTLQCSTSTGNISASPGFKKIESDEGLASPRKFSPNLGLSDLESNL